MNATEAKETASKPKTSDPIFEEGFLFLSENPIKDKLTIQVPRS
jgi:hypothetical protein